MELTRATWTDERLDDVKDEVVRQGTKIDGLSDRIDAQSDRIEGLNQVILTIGGRIFASRIAITVAIIGLIATLL